MLESASRLISKNSDAKTSKASTSSSVATVTTKKSSYVDAEKGVVVGSPNSVLDRSEARLGHILEWHREYAEKRKKEATFVRNKFQKSVKERKTKRESALKDSWKVVQDLEQESKRKQLDLSITTPPSTKLHHVDKIDPFESRVLVLLAEEIAPELFRRLCTPCEIRSHFLHMLAVLLSEQHFRRLTGAEEPSSRRQRSWTWANTSSLETRKLFRSHAEAQLKLVLEVAGNRVEPTARTLEAILKERPPFHEGVDVAWSGESGSDRQRPSGISGLWDTEKNANLFFRPRERRSQSEKKARIDKGVESKRKNFLKRLSKEGGIWELSLIHI